MNSLMQLVGCVVALAVLGAAFMYPFIPRQTQALLKKLGITIALLLIAPALLSRIGDAGNSLSVVAALLAVSVIAYLLRKQRHHRSPVVRRSGPAERTPLLPRATTQPENAQESKDTSENEENSDGGLDL